MLSLASLKGEKDALQRRMWELNKRRNKERDIKHGPKKHKAGGSIYTV